MGLWRAFSSCHDSVQLCQTQLTLGMLNPVFSCNRSSIVQNRILTEARSLPVDAYHAMSTENAMRNRKRCLT